MVSYDHMKVFLMSNLCKMNALGWWWRELELQLQFSPCPRPHSWYLSVWNNNHICMRIFLYHLKPGKAGFSIARRCAWRCNSMCTVSPHTFRWAHLVQGAPPTPHHVIWSTWSKCLQNHFISSHGRLFMCWFWPAVWGECLYGSAKTNNHLPTS